MGRPSRRFHAYTIFLLDGKWIVLRLLVYIYGASHLSVVSFSLRLCSDFVIICIHLGTRWSTEIASFLLLTQSEQRIAIETIKYIKCNWLYAYSKKSNDITFFENCFLKEAKMKILQITINSINGSIIDLNTSTINGNTAIVTKQCITPFSFPSSSLASTE